MILPIGRETQNQKYNQEFVRFFTKNLPKQIYPPSLIHVNSKFKQSSWTI